MAAAGADVLVRLLSIPILALVVLGFGTAAEHSRPGNPAAQAADTTLGAGSARFVASFSRSETGVIDLRNETAVLDNGAVFGVSYRYWPLPAREPAVLGIPAKRWFADKTSGYDLVDDPFLTGTRALLEVIGRAERVHALGPGIERGSPVQRYSAKIPLDVFLSKLPPFEKEVTKPGDAGPTSWRDYLVSYMGADLGGQNLNLAVDSHGRIRSARLDLYEPVTVEFYDYGVRVDASAPPGNEVISSTAYEQLKSDYCSSPRRQTLPRPYPCQ